MTGGVKRGKAAFPSHAKGDHLPQADAFEERRSPTLLTHHQPIGWSPALAKGGDTCGERQKMPGGDPRPYEGRRYARGFATLLS